MGGARLRLSGRRGSSVGVTASILLGIGLMGCGEDQNQPTTLLEPSLSPVVTEEKTAVVAEVTPEEWSEFLATARIDGQTWAIALGGNFGSFIEAQMEVFWGPVPIPGTVMQTIFGTVRIDESPSVRRSRSFTGVLGPFDFPFFGRTDQLVMHELDCLGGPDGVQQRGDIWGATNHRAAWEVGVKGLGLQLYQLQSSSQDHDFCVGTGENDGTDGSDGGGGSSSGGNDESWVCAEYQLTPGCYDVYIDGVYDGWICC